MNIELFLKKYNELKSNKFIDGFFIKKKIQCGLYFIENGNYELRYNIDKNYFFDSKFIYGKYSSFRGGTTKQ